MVISNWFTLMEGEGAVPDGFRQAIQWLAELFYANDGLLASPRMANLQSDLDILTGPFNRVVLQTNVDKMDGML